MPTPIFQPYSPGIGDDLNKRIKGLTNAYIDTTQQLQWLLTHLDEKNVLKAQSVVADWVYAGNIKTNQLIAGETLIDNALIKSLSASKITAGTITASISIYGPTIVGGTITGGIVRTASSGQRLSMDSSGITSYNSSDQINGIAIESGSYGYSKLGFYQNGMNVGSFEYDSFGRLYLSGLNDVVIYPGGTWDFSLANVRYLNVTAKFG
jgi:hypothetical protein